MPIFLHASYRYRYTHKNATYHGMILQRLFYGSSMQVTLHTPLDFSVPTRCCTTWYSYQVSFLFIPIYAYYPRTTSTLALFSSSNSDPGSHSRPSSPLPTTVRAFIFIARRSQHILSSSAGVELCLPTLLGALSSFHAALTQPPVVLDVDG